MVILLNKAHYWVLKQHTDSTPQLALSSKFYRWTVIHVISFITAFPRQLNQLYQRFVCHANPFSVIHTTMFLS